MTLPRFSENLVVNNVVLTLGACVFGLLALAAAVWLTLWLARRTARATHLDAAEGVVERARGPLRSLAMTGSVFIVLGACAGLALSVYARTDLQAWVDRAATDLTPEVGLHLLEGLAVVAGLAVFSFWLRRTLRPLLPAAERRLLTGYALDEDVAAVRGLLGLVVPLINVVVLYIALRLASRFFDVAGGPVWLALTVVFALMVLHLTRASIHGVHLLTVALDRLGSQRFKVSGYRPYYDGVRGLWPLARRTYEAVAWIGGATLIISEFEALEGFTPYGPRIIRLIAIYFVARVVVELSRVLVAESLNRRVDPRDEVAKRRTTLIFLVQSVTKYVIYFGAVVLMLGELGIDPAPFLAGAGIVGLTVGLGAQKLVNDMVSGFFMLFEGQILTGDYVATGDVEGVVEAVHLRVTEIRDNDGRLHTLRNGNIEHLVNYSRDYVHAVIDLSVAYDSDLETVWTAIRDAGQRLRDELPELVLADTEIAGVETFGDAAVNVRTVTRVQPSSHLQVGRAMRKHLLAACADHKVDIPYPHFVLIHRGMPPVATGKSE